MWHRPLECGQTWSTSLEQSDSASDSASDLLLQQLSFKLFGFPYLVGIIKFNVSSPLVIGEVS